MILWQKLLSVPLTFQRALLLSRYVKIFKIFLFTNGLAYNHYFYCVYNSLSLSFPIMNSAHHLLQKLPVNLKNLALKEWEDLFDYLGFRASSRTNVYKAIFNQNITSSEEIDSLTDKERNQLKELTVFPASTKQSLLQSQDRSWKLTLRLHDGKSTETVIIPEWRDDKLTKCSVSISSQVGCFFGCSFCATGKMGFHRNLSTGELLDQVREAEHVVKNELNTDITHLYFMGMGEPMHNYRAVSDALSIMRDPSAPGPPLSQITVSTVGLFRQIRMLAQEHPEVNLAVSIHSADQEVRKEIMPVSARLGLAEIRDALIYYTRKTGHPVTIQYLLMQGINDRQEDAEKLVAYLRQLPAKITLIMFNDIADSNNKQTEVVQMQEFRKKLDESGFNTDVRWCYGEDIEAGCGQLNISTSQERVSMSMRNSSRGPSVTT